MSVICHHTMSLDGFIAGPGDSMDWAFAHGVATSMADETMAGIGAILAGRRWYDLAMERWEGVDGIYGGNYGGRVFVLTHRPPDDGGDPRISFISGGIEGAVATAEAAAGNGDIGIFGASLTRQCLRAGLLDEIASTWRRCCSAAVFGCSPTMAVARSRYSAPVWARPSN